MLFVGIFLLALMAIGLMIFWVRYFRDKPQNLVRKDKVMGFLLFGSFFQIIHSDLSKRGYKLTKREWFGWFVVALLMLIALIFGFVSPRRGG